MRKRQYEIKQNGDGKYCLFDNETGETYDCEDAIDVLNELFDENEELKEENEQLRQQVQILKKEVRDFLHLCDVCDIQSHLSDECEEVLNDE